MNTSDTEERIHEPGEHAREHDAPHDHGHEHGVERADNVRVAVLAMVVAASLSGWWRSYFTRDWLALAATTIGGIPIFAEAW